MFGATISFKPEVRAFGYLENVNSIVVLETKWIRKYRFVEEMLASNSNNPTIF